MATTFTIKQRRAQLTEKCNRARQEWENAVRLAKYTIRTAHPGLKEKDWAKFYELVDNDIRVMLANVKLQALCDAANIMGAEIY